MGYKTAKICIPEVTGNIVISATPIQSKYTIAYNLQCCSSSSNLEIIDKNTSYSTTLTPNNQYCTITSVVVTMGNVDITSTVYNSTDNSILINDVTANVSIVVTGYENLSHASEWLTNYCIQNSTTKIISRNRTYVSNLIPISSGDVFYIKNAQRMSNYHPALFINNNQVQGVKITATKNDNEYLTTGVVLSNIAIDTSSTTFTNNPDSTNASDYQYIRFSFSTSEVSSINDVIITKNEMTI